MREPKKKSGDMARARYRHLRRQEIQDAISAVTRGEIVQVKIHGGLWELSPVNLETDLFPAIYLVRVNGNRLQVGWVSDKDGVRLVTGPAAPFHCSHPKALLAHARAVDETAKNYC